MSTALSEALQRLENSIRERAAQRPAQHPGSAAQTQTIRRTIDANENMSQLPLFDLDKRAQRIYLKGESFAIPGIGAVSYRGQELRGDDWAVWSQIVALAKRSAEANWISFSPFTLLKNLRWSNSRYDRMRLRACLERMQATVLRLPGKYPNSLISLSLIERCEWIPSPKGRSGCWRVKLDPEIKKRFIDDQLH